MPRHVIFHGLGYQPFIPSSLVLINSICKPAELILVKYGRGVTQNGLQDSLLPGGILNMRALMGAHEGRSISHEAVSMQMRGRNGSG